MYDDTLIEKPEGRQAAQARMLEAIKEIKADTARYEALKARLKGKKTDAERAEVLVDFIVDNKDLTKAVPSGQPEEALGITTVTVTTVLIFATSAY